MLNIMIIISSFHILHGLNFTKTKEGGRKKIINIFCNYYYAANVCDMLQFFQQQQQKSFKKSAQYAVCIMCVYLSFLLL